MKQKILKIVIPIILIGSFFLPSYQVRSQDQFGVFKTIGTAVTNIAGSTTNSAAGPQFELYHAENPIRIFLTAQGVAGTTNGTGGLTVKFSSSFDSNTWDTATLSAIKVNMSALGGATNTVSDWFATGGAHYIRVGQIENGFVGAVSNISVTIGLPSR